MTRYEIIKAVGEEWLESNIENGEFSYPKAFKQKGKTFTPIKDPDTGRAYEKLDIRFVKEGVSVLIETKDDFTSTKNKKCFEQLSAYVEYEKELTGNKIVAILANTSNNKIRVYRGAVADDNIRDKETAIRTMEEYVDFYTQKINDKEQVMKNTYALNELLHKHSIPEKARSQFVGTCLLALKNGLLYENNSTKMILAGIEEKLEGLLNSSLNKAEKIKDITSKWK